MIHGLSISDMNIHVSQHHLLKLFHVYIGSLAFLLKIMRGSVYGLNILFYQPICDPIAQGL